MAQKEGVVEEVKVANDVEREIAAVILHLEKGLRCFVEHAVLPHHPSCLLIQGVPWGYEPILVHHERDLHFLG
jgi:hypothetical protein